MSSKRNDSFDNGIHIVKRNPTAPEKIAMARQFRKEPTPKEDEVWQWIRNRQICHLKWRRQQIISGYIADFYCDEIHTVLEIDGSVHDDPDQIKYDKVREERFKQRGIKTIRIKNEDCTQDNIRKIIEGLI